MTQMKVIGLPCKCSTHIIPDSQCLSEIAGEVFDDVFVFVENSDM